MRASAFSERNVLAPEPAQAKLTLLCWLLYQWGIPWLVAALCGRLGFDLRMASAQPAFQTVVFALVFALVAVVYRRFLWQSIKVLRGQELRLLVTVTVGLLSLLLLNSLLQAGMALLLPGAENHNNAAVSGMLVERPLLMALCTVVLAPVIEEVLVRGGVFAPLCRRRPWLAYLVSVTLFSAMHIAGYAGTYLRENPLFLLASFCQYLPAGLVFGWAYQRTRSVCCPILIHSLSNLLAVLATLKLL